MAMATDRHEVTNGGLLYHEVQESKLCAVHCVNTVLQGPFFSEFDLATIATDLDQKERQMMMEGGLDSADYMRFMSEDSSNVAMDGDFSIQVLEKALEIWDLHVIPLDSPLAGQAQIDPQNEEGFICHLQNHWFCIRKVDGEWYNFNSLYPAPEHLSKFYLSAYLDTLKGSGWSIFLVRGNFPRECPVSGSDGSNGFGQWLTPEDAQRITKSTSMTHNASPDQKPVSIPSSADMQGSTSLNTDNLNYEDSQLRAAIAASLSNTSPPPGDQSVQSVYPDTFSKPFSPLHGISDAEDQELMAAIAASLKDSVPPRGNFNDQDVAHSPGFVSSRSMALEQNAELSPNVADKSLSSTVADPIIKENSLQEENIALTATTVGSPSLNQNNTTTNQVPQVTVPMPNTVSLSSGYTNVSELAFAMAASLADVQVPPRRDPET
uniref:ubiquitinyl hydrolase 1 n=2 Tax=Araucaria cunninghamii TaxID=56994 RepID=A0A0D6QUY8_ARACU